MRTRLLLISTLAHLSIAFRELSCFRCQSFYSATYASPHRRTWNLWGADSRTDGMGRRGEVSRARQAWALDNLSPSELRAQIRARRGSHAGVFDKEELIYELALLIIREEQVAHQEERKQHRDQSKRALRILDEKRKMRSMSDDAIVSALKEGGMREVHLYHSRSELESALATLRLGEFEPSAPAPPVSTSNSSGLDDFRSLVTSALNDFAMTDSEKAASTLLAQHSDGSLTPSDDEHNRCRALLATANTFDEARSICSSFSRSLLLLLLEKDYDIRVSEPMPRRELVNILCDSVCLRRKVVHNYSALTEAPPRVPSRNWKESVLLPEKELMIWAMALFKRVEDRAQSLRESMYAPTASFASIARNSSIASANFGTAIALRIGEWATGDRSNAPAALLSASALTIVFRRGIIFFFGTILAMRMLRFRVHSFMQKN